MVDRRFPPVWLGRVVAYLRRAPIRWQFGTKHPTTNRQRPTSSDGKGERVVKVAGVGLAEPGGRRPPLQGRRFSVLSAEF